MAKKKKKVKYFWLLSLLVLLPGFCLGAAPTPTPGHHNWLSNHATTAARKNLHQPGYIVADAAARAAVTTMRDADILYQQDTDVYYVYDGAAWLEFAMVAEAQTMTNKTLNSAILDTGVSGTAVQDDDTFASPSASKLASSESIKAYVDAQIAAVAVGDWEKIGATQTASASATINFSSLDTATYRDFKLIGSDIIPATDAAIPWIRVSKAAAFLAGVADYSWARSSISDGGTGTDSADSSDSEIQIGIEVGTAAGESMSFVLTLFNPGSTANTKKIQFDSCAESEADIFRRFMGMGAVIDGVTAVDGIQMLFSTGNIESGLFTLYGRRQ